MSTTLNTIVAVYYGEGTRAGAIWFMNALDTLDINYIPLTEKDIQHNHLNGFDCIFFGSGGFYYDYLDKSGCENVTTFVKSGGGYIGHCGGSVAAANPYPGSPGSKNLVLIPIDMRLDHKSSRPRPFFVDERKLLHFKKSCSHIPFCEHLPSWIPMVYWQGPIFYEPGRGDIHVILRFPQDGAWSNSPAMLCFTSPDNGGSVVVCCAHPEMYRNTHSLSLLQHEIAYASAHAHRSEDISETLTQISLDNKPKDSITKTIHNISTHAEKLICIIKAIPAVTPLFYCYPEYLMIFLQRLIKECTDVQTMLSRSTGQYVSFPDVGNINRVLEDTGRFLTSHARFLSHIHEEKKEAIQEERNLYQKTVDNLKYTILPLIRWNILHHMEQL